MIATPPYIKPPMAFSLKEGTSQRTAFGLAVLSTATQIALAAIITHLAITTPNSSPVFAATLAAVVFDFIVLIVLIGIVVFSLVARSRTSRTLQLSLSATSFVLFVTASILSIYVLGRTWTKIGSADTNSKPFNSHAAVLAGFVVWTINMVAQTMLHIFRSLRKREQAPSEHVESIVEPQASPRSMMKRSLSFPLKNLASPSSSPFLKSTFEVTSPTMSTHSASSSNLRHSIQQAIRPITSRTKLMLTHTPTPRESGSFAATRENNSLEISCRGDGFETWDTSSVEQGFVNPFVTSPTTGIQKKKLEPIPGSRPVSPAKPLDGPFPSTDDEPEKHPLPDSPMQSPMRLRFPNDSTDTLPVPPLLLHRNSSQSSSSQEAHIHPLFRSHSPTPPPTPSADTIITASPFAGQVIHSDHAMAPKRMQSARTGGGSQPTSPHAFTPPLRSGSFPSLRRPSNLSTRHPLELDPEDVPEMPKL